MYCGKCGEKIEEGIKFCPKCGNIVSGKSIHTNTEIVENSVDKTGRNQQQSRWVGILIIAVLVLVAGILMKNLLVKSPEDIAIQACKAEISGNIDKYYKLLAPPYLNYMVGQAGWFDTEEEFKEVLQEYADDLRYRIESNCGEDFRAEYEVDSIETCDSETLERVQKELRNYYDYEENVQDAVKVNVRMTFKGDEDRAEYISEISCVKIKGRWYVHRPEIDSI